MHFNIVLLVVATVTASVNAGITPHPNQVPIVQRKGSLKGVRKALKKADIINEVLDDFKPKCSIIPLYGVGPVILGNEFNQSDTKDAPGLNMTCSEIKGDTGFVVALTDPDAKSRNDPKWSEMCHWILTISSFNETDTNILTDGDTRLNSVVDYKSPGPPPKTGYHRYIFVVLAGDISNLTAPTDRQHWGTGKVRHGVRDWAEKEGLRVVGANYFVEQNEEQ